MKMSGVFNHQESWFKILVTNVDDTNVDDIISSHIDVGDESWLNLVSDINIQKISPKTVGRTKTVRRSKRFWCEKKWVLKSS